MATNLVQDGDTITITAGGTITSGSLVVTGALFGVAVTDAASGDSVALMTEGVFDLPKVTGAVSVGDIAYWDSSESKVTVTRVTDTGDLRIGIVVADATSGAANARVKLCCCGSMTEAVWVETVQDLVGAMVSGNVESGMTLTYDDTNGKLNGSVP